jgi:hypothetical protein
MTPAPGFGDTLVMVTRDGMGSAESELARKLLVKYLELLLANGTPPGAIAFYAQGVFAVCEGSPALPALGALEAKGVRLVVCKTCLDFYGVADQVRAGVVGGMGDIVAAQVMAKKVVTV